MSRIKPSYLLVIVVAACFSHKTEAIIYGSARSAVAFATSSSRRRRQPKHAHSSPSCLYESAANDQQEEDLTPLAFGSPPETSSFPQQQLPLLQLALAGSLASLVGDVTMHPVDCIKTVQQSEVGISMNVVQAISYLYTSSGIAGFYHGFLTYAISDALGGAVKFSVWESWKQHNNKASFGNLAVGAALAFIAASFILVPGELLKQQLQMSYYDSLYEAVQGIYTSFGILGFFSGYDGVVYRDVPYTILELGLYEVFKQQQQIITKRSALDEVVAAAATGGIVAFLTTPLDTVKTKLMVDSLDANFWDCLLSTIQNHGYESLFAGTLARVAWIMPFTAIYLPTYDLLKRMLVSSQQRRYYEQRQNDDNSIER